MNLIIGSALVIYYFYFLREENAKKYREKRDLTGIALGILIIAANFLIRA